MGFVFRFPWVLLFSYIAFFWVGGWGGRGKQGFLMGDMQMTNCALQ